MKKNSGNDKQELIETLKQAKEEGQTELSVSVERDNETAVYVGQFAGSGNRATECVQF
jgi:hypothetical protein